MGDTGHAGHVSFFPITQEEFHAANRGMAPKHKMFSCGSCGQSTNGRVLCHVIRRPDSAAIFWCDCSCERHEPTILIERGGQVLAQLPHPNEFTPAGDWPSDLSKLYDEASRAFGAGAYTAATMAARKILMSCACDKGAKDGEPFTAYVDYITSQVLAFPAAKAAIDAIRTIGNDATHKLEFVNQADARRAMKIVTYMLNTIYSLPVA